MSQQRPSIGDRFERQGRIVEAVATGAYGRTLKCRNTETGRHSDISIHVLRDRWRFVEPTPEYPVEMMNRITAVPPIPPIPVIEHHWSQAEAFNVLQEWIAQANASIAALNEAVARG